MARIVKVGAGGDEIDWHQALKDLRADDVLMLEPGFYELPQGLVLADITIKGIGASPDDTTILGYFSLDPASRFVTLENICINTNTDHNTISIPAEANGYLTMRNCTLKGYGNDTAVIAVNGKSTIEMFSTKVQNGSVSMFENADFRLEMNDSLIDYYSEEFCALALEGQGTAIINNSRIHGSTNTFKKSNVELDFNNSQIDFVLLHGQTWMNMLNSQIMALDDSCLYISDDSWVNIVHSTFNGGVYIDKNTRTIIQNSVINRLIAVNEAKITMTGTQILAHADFQDKVLADVTRTSFNGNFDYQYFLALSGQAVLKGHDLIFNANDSELAVQDDASLNANILASDRSSLEIECNKKPNVHILGMHWTARRK